jgi:hypothetical protein
MHLSLFVVGNEPFVLWILHAFFDMKSERDGFEEISVSELIILLEIIKKRFLVA